MKLTTQQPAVILSADTCDLLNRIFNLRAVHNHVRDRPRIAQEIADIREITASFRALPEATGSIAEVAQDLERWLTPQEVADLEGITDRAVRLACTEGRIPAQQVGGRWQISRTAYEDYRRERTG
jgi:excisionase family DNA binding protein